MSSQPSQPSQPSQQQAKDDSNTNLPCPSKPSKKHAISKVFGQDDSLQQELIALQMMVAHLENDVSRLDAVITQQDKQIAQMQRQLQLMYGYLQIKHDDGIMPFDLLADKPPHY